MPFFIRAEGVEGHEVFFDAVSDSVRFIAVCSCGQDFSFDKDQPKVTLDVVEEVKQHFNLAKNV